MYSHAKTLIYYLVLQLVSIPSMDWYSSSIDVKFTNNRTLSHEFRTSDVAATFSQTQQPYENILHHNKNKDRFQPKKELN